MGEHLGKYVLVGELAKGGMAELFLALHKGPEGFLKVVVVKRVLPHLTQNAEFVQMFADEARLAARLEHANIVRTWEFGASQGNYFTVMEYLAGEDLANVLRRLAESRQVLSIQAACTIALEVCKALHFAHELTDTAGRPLGLVHRDVNPSNVIITYSGDVKLIDFGVAKTTVNVSKTIAGSVKGKLAYMAPEQIIARGFDRRADVFSLGVVLWETLAIQPLFGRDGDAATMYAIMNDPIPLVSKYRPDVPPALDAIVSKALSRTPADRYETAAELMDALEEFLATQPGLDSRYLPTTMETLFGWTRAGAKRAIQRGQALKRNISLVMKLRSDVHAGLAAQLQRALSADDPPRSFEPPAGRSRSILIAISAILLLAIGGGLVYVATRGSGTAQPQVQHQATAIIQLDSRPSGAAVFINGEPTGYVTPATLKDILPGELTIRLALAGHTAVETKLTAVAGKTTEQVIPLEPEQGRLVIAGLSADAAIVVDGTSYPAGEAIPLNVGSHDVAIVVGDSELVRQTIAIGSGDQNWQLRGARLEKR
ncbi:MAG: serine/threonine protein kinase [Kofleriaceae bacterium]|nr:serine/threonine protein kinase [Kofleriaceae bacterium]